MKRIAWVGIVVGTLMSAAAAPLGAQTLAGGRAFPGQFDRSATRPDARHNLEFVTTLSEAYDQDVFADLGTRINPLTPQASGFSTMLWPSASYSLRGRRAQLVGNASSALRYLPDVGQVRSITHAASIGIRTSLTRGTSLILNSSAVYSPVHLFRLFPELDADALATLPQGGANYAISRSESFAYRSIVTVDHRLGQRGTLSASGGYESTDYRHQPLEDVRTWIGEGDYRHQMTRNLAATSRYRFRRGNFGYGASTTAREHAVDLGLNYSRPMSSTRRMEFDVRLGASAMRIPTAIDEDAIPSWRNQFQGEVSGSYDLGRTWQARAVLRRGAEFVSIFPQPVFADSASLHVQGLLTRSLELAVSAAYSTGASALSRDSMVFDTYVGNVRFSYVLTSAVAPFVEYVYYYYDFRGSTQLGPGTPRFLERNGWRAGLSVWFPVVRR
jgi:hypothetical protein